MHARMRALLFLGGLLAVFLEPMSLVAADPGQQILDAHGEDERFAEAHVGKLATDKFQCGVQVPEFPETLAGKDTSVKVLGEGSLGLAELHKFIASDQQCSATEKRLLSPRFVTKSTQCDVKMRPDTLAELWEEAYTEFFAGKLITDSALPESPVAQVAGLVNPNGGKNCPIFVLSYAGGQNLQSLLKNGNDKETYTAWQQYTEKFLSFLPAPVRLLSRPAHRS
jgi:hypothetical protein